MAKSKGGGGGRDVKFTIGTDLNPKYKDALEKLAKETLSTQEKILKGERDLTKAIEQEYAKRIAAAQSAAKLQQQAMNSVSSGGSGGGGTRPVFRGKNRGGGGLGLVDSGFGPSQMGMSYSPSGGVNGSGFGDESHLRSAISQLSNNLPGPAGLAMQALSQAAFAYVDHLKEETEKLVAASKAEDERLAVARQLIQANKDQIEAIHNEIDAKKAGANYSGPEKDIKENEVRLYNAQKGVDKSNANFGRYGGSDPEKAQALVDAQIEAEKQVYALEKSIVSERLKINQAMEHSNNANLKAVQHELDLQQKITKEQEHRLTSAAERFADLDPLKQAQAKTALDKLQNGGNLNKKEKELVSHLGIETANQQLSAKQQAQARAAGFEDIAQVKNDRINVGKGQENADNLAKQVKVFNEISVSLVDDRKKTNKELEDKFNHLLNRQLAIEASLGPLLQRNAVARKIGG